MFKSVSFDALGELGCDAVAYMLQAKINRINFLSISKRYPAHVLALEARNSTYFTDTGVCTYAGSVSFRDATCEKYHITVIILLTCEHFPSRVGTGEARVNIRHYG